VLWQWHALVMLRLMQGLAGLQLTGGSLGPRFRGVDFYALGFDTFV
jgi:hypothetical protein